MAERRGLRNNECPNVYFSPKFTHLHVRGVSMDTVDTSDYISSNNRKTRQISIVCSTKGLKDSRKKQQDSRHPSWDSNQALPNISEKHHV